MLTSKLKSFISLPGGMGLGTRDANLTPDFARVLGAMAVDDFHIKLFIDELSSTRSLANMRDNQWIAFVIVDIMSAESYQFKGKFISAVKANEQDMIFFDQYMKGFDDLVDNIGLNRGLIYDYPHTSMICITMEVQEIFEQTPKKGTGQKI
jgi:hypothetical protein